MPESAVLEFAPEMRQRWAWSADDMRHFGHLVVDLIAHHLTSLPERPVFRPLPPELAERFLSAALPLTGQEPEEILAEFARDVEPYPFGNGHPRFYGWVNSPPAVIEVFAEALAAAMNPSVAGGNHAATYVERQVLNWFRDLLGFPTASMGLLVSGGSMATLTGLAVARHVHLKAKLGVDVRASGLQSIGHRLLVYTSTEGHSCIRKAVELLGLGSDNLRVVPVDAQRCLQVQALEAALRQDLEAGHVPIAVAASAGTVNSGAIDPLAALRTLCDRYGLWLHVDGAYGALAILSAQYRQEIEPIALADSVALDPHKWLYIPVEAGLVLIRDGQAMRDTFSLVPPYLRNDGQTDEIFGLPWFSEYGFQQTRGFRMRGSRGYGIAAPFPLNSRIQALVAHPTEAHTMLAGGDTGLFVSHDGGAQWERIGAQGDVPTIWSLAIDPVDPRMLFAGTRPAGVYRSRDGGLRWEKLAIDIAPECSIGTPFVTSVMVDPDDHRMVWAGVEIDGVFRSLDGGDTWPHVETGLYDPDIHAMTVAATHPTRVYASTAREVFASNNMGETWQPLGIREKWPLPYARGIAVKADNPEVLFAGCGETTTGEKGHVLRTTNFGETWETLALPTQPNATVWGLATHPADANRILAFSLFGEVYMSDDAGESWRKIAREFGEIRTAVWVPN